VCVDHEGFAGFVELAAIVAASLGFEAHFVEDAPAAARGSFGGGIHDSMVERASESVNWTSEQVFREEQRREA